MARLIHLNGAPGVGKSTLAERYVAEHPGVLNADVDRLRCFVGGWDTDFEGTGAIIRPVALAMIRAHLDGGHDVVLPQMLARERERARFRAAAEDGGHEYRHLLLQAPPGEAAARFASRVPDPLNELIRGIVEADGGAAAITGLEERLAEQARAGDAVVIEAAGEEATYRAVLAALSLPNH